MCLAAIVWILLLLPVVLLVRRDPESVGLQPDGDTSPRFDQLCTAPPAMLSPAGWRLGEACRTKPFWLLLFSSSSVSLVSTALTFHHVSLFPSKGFEPALAAGVLSFMAPMALVGSFTAGFLTDRIPNRFVLALALLLFVLALLWVSLLSSPWQAFLYGSLVGLSQDMLMTTNIVIWPNYFGKHISAVSGELPARPWSPQQHSALYPSDTL